MSAASFRKSRASSLKLLPERLLGAAQKLAGRRGFQIECGCQFLVAKAFTAEHQHLRISWMNCRQNSPDHLLPLAGVPKIFRCRHAHDHRGKPLISRVTRPSPQFVKPHADSGSIQPAFDISTLSLRISPQLQEHLNCKFLRACAVADDSRNGAGYALVLSAKDCLDMKRLRGGRRLVDGIRYVHISTTFERRDL